MAIDTATAELLVRIVDALCDVKRRAGPNCWSTATTQMVESLVAEISAAAALTRDEKLREILEDAIRPLRWWGSQTRFVHIAIWNYLNESGFDMSRVLPVPWKLPSGDAYDHGSVWS